MLTDIRDAWRGLIAARGTSALALAILTIAIGAATVTFSVVDAIALRPLPFGRPDRLVSIAISTVTSTAPGQTTPQAYFAWRERVTAFESIGAHRFGGSVRLQVGDRTEGLVAARATANFFDVLGVRPVMGRAFVAAHEQAGQDQVAILGHAAWVKVFNSDPGVIGRRVAFGSVTREIVGVMSPGFTYPVANGEPVGVWFPYVPRPNDRTYATGGRSYEMNVVGRLKDGETIERARTQVEQVFTETESTGGGSSFDERVHVTSLLDRVVGPAKSWLLLALAAVVFVLLIACANVAGLLLARATVRARELAVREALGASRARLARTLLCEGLLLSVASAAAGLALSYWGVDVAKSLLPPGLARATAIALDGRVLMLAIGATLICGALFSTAPAWLASKSGLSGVMKSNSGAVIGGRSRARWLGLFVIAEMAFVAVLLVATGLAVTSFVRVSTLDLGFNRTNVATIGFRSARNIPEADRLAAAVAVRSEVIERARATPGVERAAIIAMGGVPLGGGSTRYSINVPGRGELAGTDSVELREVTPDYFAVMGLQVTRGRAFDATDTIGAPLAVVINEEAAARFFPAANPLGRVVRLQGNRTIIGVTRSIRLRGPEVDVRPEAYLPLGQSTDTDASGWIVVRTAGPPAPVAALVRDAIRPALGGAEPAQAQVIDDAFRTLTAPRRFNAGLLTLFGVVGVFIGAIGVFGTMAFVVAQRTRAIGLRMALGATSQRILRGVLRQSAWYVTSGTAIGLGAAWAASRLLSALAFGVQPTDARLYLSVAATLVVVGILAALIPARRAARIDPLTALRAE